MLLLLPGAMLLLALRQLPRTPTWWWLALQAALLFPFGASWLVVWLANGLLAQPDNALTGWVTLLYDVPTVALLLFAGLQGWLLWRAASYKSSLGNTA